LAWREYHIEEDGPLHPRDHEVGPLPNHVLLHALEPMRRGLKVSSVLDPDPDWIRIQSKVIKQTFGKNRSRQGRGQN
jgi:hypothetical protein